MQTKQTINEHFKAYPLWLLVFQASSLRKPTGRNRRVVCSGLDPNDTVTKEMLQTLRITRRWPTPLPSLPGSLRSLAKRS